MINCTGLGPRVSLLAIGGVSQVLSLAVARDWSSQDDPNDAAPYGVDPVRPRALLARCPRLLLLRLHATCARERRGKGGARPFVRRNKGGCGHTAPRGGVYGCNAGTPALDWSADLQSCISWLLDEFS
jgi:hypothetical protein